MRIIRKILRRLCCGFGQIHLIDKCLLLFMLVLLAQSVVGLFVVGNGAAQMGTMDVIFRTSCASIFGYFLSANFMRHTDEDEPEIPTQPPSSLEGGTGQAPQARIGFTKQGEPLEAGKAQGASKNPRQGLTASRLQIFVATGIGLFCLLSLMLFRNFSGVHTAWMDTPYVAATVAQFRDFVSGCVGFLIGCPTTKSGKS